jgi:hypothetical protein
MQLNQNQLKILQLIDNGIQDSPEIAKVSGLSSEVVKYYIIEMQADGYLLCTEKLFMDRGIILPDPSEPRYLRCELNTKGKVALENPGLLLHPKQGSMSHTTIHAQTVGFVNSGNGSVSHFTQNIGENIGEIRQVIDSLMHTAQGFPEEQRDEALLHLEDLESDLSKPEKQTPKRIKHRIAALWAIACILGAGISGAVTFSKDILDLAEKLGVPVELDLPPATRQLPPSP